MQENGLSKTRNKFLCFYNEKKEGFGLPFFSFLMVMTEMSDFLMSGVLGL